jgi:uncharacterized protein (TIGR04255 family)
MRFSVAAGRGVELLPGVMLAALGQDFPRLEQMPLGTIPKDMRAKTPELQHAPVFKLQGHNEAVLLGDCVASFNATRPYPGWSQFRARAMQVASALKDSGHVATLDRYSLKYVNIVDSSTASPTAPFNLHVSAGSREFSSSGFRLRFETEIDGFLNIVELASDATSAVGTNRLSGTLITIDTIMESAAEKLWGNLEQRLNATHDVLETLFFELLTKEAIGAMGPSYD